MKIFKNKNITKLFILGLLSSLAFAPFYLIFIFFYSLKYILTDIENQTIKQSFFTGWLFGFGYFIGNCYWYCNSLLIEPLKFAWLIPFAISLIPAFLAIYLGLTCSATKYIISKLKIQNKFLIILIFSFFWTIFEFLRGILFTGFPWNLICYSLSFSITIIQIVSILGSYIFSFFVLIIYCSLYIINDKKYRKYIIFNILLLLSIIFFGIIRLQKKETVKNENIKVRLIQPNISQKIKLLGQNNFEIFNKLIEMSIEDSDNIDYLIWPESAIPYVISNNENNEILLKALNNKLKNKTLITGIVRFEDKKVYNSIIAVKNGKIIDYYDKYFLVPFGEFVPFRKFIPLLNSIVGDLDFSKSENKNKILRIDEVFPVFSPNICYESIFYNSINKNAKLIVNLTNDAWFGNTSGPYQHFDALRFRALENNIPAIRVANSGISAFIDKYGRIIKKINLNKTGYIDINI